MLSPLREQLERDIYGRPVAEDNFPAFMFNTGKSQDVVSRWHLERKATVAIRLHAGGRSPDPDGSPQRRILFIGDPTRHHYCVSAGGGLFGLFSK